MFFGYNFYYDKNALSPCLVDSKKMTSWKIENGIFTEVYIRKGENEIISGDLPTIWDDKTLALCNFLNNINLGNVDFLQQNISKMLLKRRIKTQAGEVASEWVTLAEIIIEKVEDFKVIHHDYFCANHTDYEFALALIDKTGITQSSLYIQEVRSEFSQVMLVDEESVFYLTSEYAMPSASRVQRSSTTDTLGNKYPITIKNGTINYNKMSISTVLLTNTTLNDIERFKQVLLQNNLFDNLVNGKPKILKDLNGNIYLIVVTGEPSYAPMKELGNGIATISFEANEQGDATKNKDLTESGILPIKPLFSYNGVKSGYPKVYNYPTGASKLLESVITEKNTNN